MRIIEPCCAPRQLLELRDSIKDGGKTQFQGFGDLSLTELLPALLTRYTETEMLIAAPVLPDQATEIISRWMRQQWPHKNGRDKLDTISRLTIIADLSEEHSPMASEWLRQNPFGDRLTLVDKAQDDTALLLPDIAITGQLNLRYGQNFTCDVTTVQEEVDALWKQYSKLTRRLPKRKQTEAPAEPEAEDVSDPAPAKSETSLAVAPSTANE